MQRTYCLCLSYLCPFVAAPSNTTRNAPLKFVCFLVSERLLGVDRETNCVSKRMIELLHKTLLVNVFQRCNELRRRKTFQFSVGMVCFHYRQENQSVNSRTRYQVRTACRNLVKVCIVVKIKAKGAATTARAGPAHSTAQLKRR